MADIEQMNPNISEQVISATIQHNELNLRPTSSEISHLWMTYMAESMSVAMLKHMAAKAKDPDFHNVLQIALDISSQNIIALENLYTIIQCPVPDSFGENDVDINAPELFTAEFSVRYTKLMQKFILINHNISFSDCSRPDIKSLFSEFAEKAKMVIAKADEVLLAKGLFPKSPYMELPDQVEYVYDKGYYGSLLGKSERPLNAVEINNIFNIIDFKVAMKALKLGFSQVTRSEQLRKHLNQGLKMADKQLEVLGLLLENDGLPKPKFIDDLVTSSTQPPYSDKLMMFHTSIAMARIILVYGLGLTNSARKDVIADFLLLMGEILKYSKDGVDIMIENRWLERVPETLDRHKLIH
ncbi:MAG: DUF3231 family protein [Thermincola sp.]|jgi:hypothetical protein|nr:DUF3231 family protein [Thermincola sp.]MDT3703793.1 DUF3231 family protein [Thermincola sp.]